MDISAMTNEELSQLVESLGVSGQATAWDDALLFDSDIALVDPSSFTVPTFPLASSQPTPYYQQQQQFGISPDLLSLPSLIEGDHDMYHSSTSCSSSYNSEDGTHSECSHHQRGGRSSVTGGATKQFSLNPPAPSDNGSSDDGRSSIDSRAIVVEPTHGKKASSKGAKKNSVSAPSEGGKEVKKRTKTGCLCCRQRRVRCCETKPDCKRCRNAGRECVWPTAENPTSTRKIPGGEVVLNNGVVVGAKKFNAETGGSKRSERGSGTKDRKNESKLVSASPVISVDAMIVSPASTPLPTFHSDSPTSTTCSSVLSPVPSELSSLAEMTTVQSPASQMAVGPASIVDLASDQWLLPWFPTAESRGLILHFCQTSSSLLMVNPPQVSPLLATLLPLALSAPRGLSKSTDGLRLTLLCLSASHQSYLLARAHAPQEIVGKALDQAIGLRSEARTLLRVANEEGEMGEVVQRLAGMVVMSVVDVLLGGHGYSKNLEMALEIVKACGGPDVMLQAETYVDLGAGAQVSTLRLLFEILAVHEVFGGLVSAHEATLINEGSWWSAGGQVSYHRESVENHFGVSRSVLSLLARANALILRASQASGAVTEHPSAEEDCLLTEDSISLAFLRDVTGLDECIPNEPDVVRIRKDAHALLRELERERVAVDGAGQGRARDGSVAYLDTAKILLLRHAFKVSRTDGRVQSAALSVLEACSSAINVIRPTHLTWPLVVASTQLDAVARPFILSLLEGFRTKCCFNVDSAEKIVREVWARLDRGEEWADWKEVVVDLDLKVLLT